MEAVDRRRENVLLGYAPRDPFSGEEMKPRGTDFSDVFGGPPRRYSMCENRSSMEDRSSLDSEPGGRLEREDSMEKPVFGGLNSPAHRRHLGGDFFDDIFRGSESPGSTPRKLERDRVTYTPSSSFRSPFRPLPPASDFSVGDSDSKSPNLSYSSRLAKTFDYSPHKPPTPRTSLKEDQKPSANDSPIQPSVPSASPVHGGETKISESPKMKEEPNSKDKILIEDTLHFSMYKWASKGVTLVLPPNLKDKSKGRSRLGIYAQVSQEPDLPLDKENLPKKISPVQKPKEPEDVTIFHSLNQSPAKAHTINLPPKVLRDITDQSDDSGFSAEMKKPKNLHQLIGDELKIESKDYLGTDFRKPAKAPREDKNPNYFQRSMSKVKEPVRNFEPQAVGSRGSTEAKVEEQHQSSKMVKKDENKLKHQLSAIPAAPKSEEEKVPSDDLGLQRKIGSTPGAFSVSRNSVDISFCEIDVADFEILDDFMEEDLPQESDEATKARSHEDEIKEWDAKIREWSRGRQGNIRSLLSTLQHVLWPGSGWKPVKLMDIIEGPSVKRAYQRALLHLHPDKLQQKGADVHHKYIAEKVFDILQEAWNQFNALGAV